ncbi:MAG: Maf family nucleotide pyrophosphatase [Candidatus Accumulibacter sp.]|jgi:septum formation protein|nr:Maf family nucleotide pyrophosphatase [Accumulibacter sp.]
MDARKGSEMIASHNFRLYLASRSPRRRELLSQIGVCFDSLVFRGPPRNDNEVDERPLGSEMPADCVQRLARAKALHGLRLVQQRKMTVQPVLSADTVIEFDGEIIGKPLDAVDAVEILKRLSGRLHRVLTAVTLSDETRIESVLSVSEVGFCALSEGEIRRYVESGDPMDKAGAYGIQGYAALFVEHLSGSYSGVMGLPLFETGQLLKRFGFLP